MSRVCDMTKWLLFDDNAMVLILNIYLPEYLMHDSLN